MDDRRARRQDCPDLLRQQGQISAVALAQYRDIPYCGGECLICDRDCALPLETFPTSPGQGQPSKRHAESDPSRSYSNNSA